MTALGEQRRLGLCMTIKETFPETFMKEKDNTKRYFRKNRSVYLCMGVTKWTSRFKNRKLKQSNPGNEWHLVHNIDIAHPCCLVAQVILTENR